MNQIFEPGRSTVETANGTVCRVETFLGSGGQGEVYQARVNNQLVALKWYFRENATPEQRQALEALIQKGPPTPTGYLWPIQLVRAPGRSDFGYLMPLREPRYHGLNAWMRRKVKPEPTFRALVTAAINLVEGFYQLHAKGLCYCDISLGNLFFDPASGDVLICDNDNVRVDGTSNIGVLGTPRFMAPEIVRSEARPSTTTDQYSMAVLLFHLLMLSHPLEGRRESLIHCLDLPSMTQLYGTNPLFIFDQQDTSNAPDRERHNNALIYWGIYPQFIKDLFTASFTTGLQNPQQGRVADSKWRTELGRLRDSIITCPACREQNFYQTATGGSAAAQRCWNAACRKPLPPPARLQIGRYTVVLSADSQIYPHHVDSTAMYAFTQPIAQVVPHPTDAQRLGLENRGTEKWTITPTNGSLQEVPPGKRVAIVAGTKIHFGAVEGEIHT